MTASAHPPRDQCGLLGWLDLAANVAILPMLILFLVGMWLPSAALSTIAVTGAVCCAIAKAGRHFSASYHRATTSPVEHRR